MKFKKAQGLPMNTIVIAAIVLVVLVVLIMIFTGSIGKWRQDIEEKPCTEVGGECQDPPCDIAAGSMPTRGKCDPGKVCCIKTTKDEETPKIGYKNIGDPCDDDEECKTGYCLAGKCSY